MRKGTVGIPLVHPFRVGRSPESHLQLDDRRVSSSHAWLRHATNGKWVLRDLGSKNGTYLNGDFLPSGVDVELAPGDLVGFGHADDAWTVEQGRPHAALIAPEEDDRRWLAVAEERVVALPTQEAPLATLLRDDGRWVLESDESELTPINDGQVFSVGSTRYRAWFSEDTEDTELVAGPPKRLARAVLELAVSRDQEQVEGVLDLGRERVALPSRVYLYVLVLMATQRRSDERDGLDRAEAGWRYTDDLCKHLAVDRQTLNIHVHRARRDVAKLGFSDPGSLFERRTLTRQMRIGIPPERTRLTHL